MEPSRYVVESLSQLQAIASPIRQEIIDVIQARGQCSIGDLAEELGRPADGLYYHVRALLAEGLLRQSSRKADNGRDERVLETAAKGSLMVAGHDPKDPATIAAKEKLVGSALKIALKDFAASLGSGQAVLEGRARNLTAGRVKSRLAGAELARVNRLFDEILSILTEPQEDSAAPLFSFAWVLAPVEAKPKRRTPKT